jgi:hydrogenase maturation protein HypF
MSASDTIHRLNDLPREGRRRLSIRMHGIVQGVGFRPSVYTLAMARGLGGWVLNDPDGVLIELEGEAKLLIGFIRELTESPPPLATITDWKARELKLTGEVGFAIHESRAHEGRRVLVSPDVAPCEDCLAEMRDPGNRRYRYPFLNCTHCGPRFTIIADLPYDRPATSMTEFELCEDCRREYEDPLDRRFHAQPTCCPVCGPRVFLLEAGSKHPLVDEVITKAAKLLAEGRIIAIKGLGGFHLAVDAGNEEAVLRLRKRKHRYEKPLALMLANIDEARRFLRLSPDEERLLTDRRRPILLAARRAEAPVAYSVAPNNGFLGVMLPYTPLHHLLLDEFGGALVMTSGNLSNEPISLDNDEALKRLGNIADAFLLHDRDILSRCDDSVFRWIAGAPSPIRRSRGEMPSPLKLPFSPPQLLAAGPEQKNTFCLTRDRDAFLSQHIGDLGNIATFDFYREALGGLKELLEIEPVAVVHDLHPRYFSTQWALEESGLPTIGVQHHHAHMASCMAENGVLGECLGICLDGTGYGPDGTVWGGELLSGDYSDFRRLGHLATARMPGADAAVRAPWRMALAWLSNMDKASLRAGGELLSRGEDGVSEAMQENILRLMASGVNSPTTSSMGRLFDAVGALLGLRRTAAYEGQGAIELEGLLHETGEPIFDGPAWKLAIREDEGILILDPAPMFADLLDARIGGMDADEAGLRFHRGLVMSLADWAERAAKESKLDRVALSGGCFMNRLLTSWLPVQLRARGLEVLVHRQVPANDGGIALGQAAVGGWRLLNETR